MAFDIDKALENGSSPDVVLALQSLAPGAQWTLRGDSWKGLDWHDQDQSKPTKKAIDAEIVRLIERKAALKYRSDRSKVYKTVQEQLDQLYWDSMNGTSVWKDDITAVKAQFPKPN